MARQMFLLGHPVAPSYSKSHGGGGGVNGKESQPRLRLARGWVRQGGREMALWLCVRQKGRKRKYPTKQVVFQLL